MPGDRFDAYESGGPLQAGVCHVTYVESDRDRERAARNRRLAYIRQHAPTILAGMLADPSWVDVQWAAMRSEAIEQAGLIFDETEAPTDG